MFNEETNWWKNPVLQGPENDYGDYDYLINSIPEDVCKMKLTSYKEKCDSCKKNSHFYRYEEVFFYTLDGYDSLWQRTCWRCIIKEKINHLKCVFRRNKENIKLKYEIWKEVHKHV